MTAQPRRPNLAVSIVAFHSSLNLLGGTLEALAAQVSPPASVLILVNGDTDGSESKAVQELCRSSSLDVPVSVQRAVDNVGFAGGHNRGCAALFAAGADAVVVLNPDLALDPEALGVLSERCRDRPDALCGPLLCLADPVSLQSEGVVDTAGIRWTCGGRHLDVAQGCPVPPAGSRPRLVAGISGACLVVPRRAYDRIVELSGEFFDEDFIAYREDAELGFRAALLGVESWLIPEATGRHARRLRGTSREVSAWVNRLSVRNRFLIAAKYGRDRPGGLFGALLRDLVVLAGVAGRERSSWPGVREAWLLRSRMRAKGNRVRRVAVISPKRAAAR
ncbi:MAG: glycosyltransferase family 2 protein [Actinomycetota bacterium]|nr:glycosyltransferase family 2 protein [Actinomycetota bacterium]